MHIYVRYADYILICHYIFRLDNEKLYELQIGSAGSGRTIMQEIYGSKYIKHLTFTDKFIYLN